MLGWVDPLSNPCGCTAAATHIGIRPSFIGPNMKPVPRCARGRAERSEWSLHRGTPKAFVVCPGGHPPNVMLHCPTVESSVCITRGMIPYGWWRRDAGTTRRRRTLATPLESPPAPPRMQLVDGAAMTVVHRSRRWGGAFFASTPMATVASGLVWAGKGGRRGNAATLGVGSNQMS